MWTRKTTTELHQTNQWRHLNPFYALFLGLAFAIASPLFIDHASAGAAVFFFAFAFIISYLIQVVSGRFFILPLFGSGDFASMDNDSAICVNCHKIQLPAKQCTNCGKELENLNDWKWVPETDVVEHHEAVDDNSHVE